VSLSARTLEVFNQLKSLTLFEAAELVYQIEECFGVIVTNRQPCQGSLCTEPPTFNVVLEEVAVDKKINVIKMIRTLKNLTLPEAKKFVESLPKIVVTDVYTGAAEDIQRQLEAAGAKASLRRIF
jgi:large subunit ribosomal protein L7/L12